MTLFLQGVRRYNVVSVALPPRDCRSTKRCIGTSEPGSRTFWSRRCRRIPSSKPTNILLLLLLVHIACGSFSAGSNKIFSICSFFSRMDTILFGSGYFCISVSIISLSLSLSLSLVFLAELKKILNYLPKYQVVCSWWLNKICMHLHTNFVYQAENFR